MPSIEQTSQRLPLPEPGVEAAERWVVEHLDGLFHEAPAEVAASPRFRGGQQAADRALAALDLSDYARNRNEAYPISRRGSTGLSPYIRHGLLGLGQVWDAVGPAVDPDRKRFCDELLWQEYARHWYARLGSTTAQPVRHLDPAGEGPGGDLDPDMACLELTVDELEEDGWLVNQTRMWLASHWSIRLGRPWREGEDWFFRHLLDGSRAANRLGWQWTTGIGSRRAYGFSRWQVERRAPGLCADCELGHACPIDEWPDEPTLEAVETSSLVAADPDPSTTSGPIEVVATGDPDTVWLTAESLGVNDPALAANPHLPMVFVFDQPLLARLRLSAKRLIFLVETLRELATEDDRDLELWLGRPAQVLAGRALAATYAPVPGWRRIADRSNVVEVHPWPWLRQPADGPISSFTAWVRGLERQGRDGQVTIEELESAG